MLTSISFKNFKSYKNAQMDLGALTLLIGANASGKSNALEALRFFSWLAQGNKLSNAQMSQLGAGTFFRGRINDLIHHGEESFTLGCTAKEKEWKELSIEVGLRHDSLHIYSETIYKPWDKKSPLYKISHASQDVNTDVKVTYNNFKSGGMKPHILCTDQMAIFTQLDSPARFSGKAGRIIPAITKNYQRRLSSILFLDAVPEKMRQYSFLAEKKLHGDGTNLSSVIYHLWHDDDEAKREANRQGMLGFIQSLPEQDIATVAFLETPRREVMLELIETFGGKNHRYDAALLSDGTLRVLAIAAAMLSAPEESIVVIEEIDNGVHPSRAEHLLQQIQKVAKERRLQIVLSTHNPVLTDALPDTAIGDVAFCYRSPDDGSSRIIKLKNIPNYPDLIAQGSLGSLMTSGILERFIKTHYSGEDRIQEGLQWLQSLKNTHSHMEGEE